MDRIVVSESGPLEGEVPIHGAKNSVLKLMAASLLAAGEYELTNVPGIVDVALMAELLEAMGAEVELAPPVCRILVPEIVRPEAPYELVERMRASIVVLGPLLARNGFARVALPGGDDFGPRPIDMHLDALRHLGAEFDTRHGNIEGRADQLLGTEVLLEYPSVGATENLLMAAVLAKGETTIENAAREPEIADLAEFLGAMGACISGAGTSTIVVEGTEELHATNHSVVPDRIEAATFLAALGVAGGELTLAGARSDHMEMLLRKLSDMGMQICRTQTGIWAAVDGRLDAVDVATLPYPGVATDYKPFVVSMLAVANGVGIVTENIFGGRFRYVDELRRMGAEIRTEGHHAVVRGRERLSGAPVRAHDIRAGAALVVAGLAASGRTEITGVDHIDRGYTDLVGSLRAVGADIERE
ncbi:MAG: UDP-N-acetylglucosamine 1-carboxyvinyltransferase [Actinomycetia bacterium]|nr:UDP-N-acetylglucosamine 1-carboxyvinyltransferase [Actinomycetes bacterium]MCP4959450.1 UDP-N-acetylglucosamine 1-carboxyvinyltransferase [Actinomycetes bacterium]